MSACTCKDEPCGFCLGTGVCVYPKARAAIRLEMLREAHERVRDVCGGDLGSVDDMFDRMIAEEEAKGGGKP